MTFMTITAIMTMALAALASEYAVAEAQLRELVVTDPLTGLPNYRRLVEVLANEIARSNRNDDPFAVAFFDMDGLKRINDELGHLIGSRAVCRFAETLRASCRATDTAGAVRRRRIRRHPAGHGRRGRARGHSARRGAARGGSRQA